PHCSGGGADPGIIVCLAHEMSLLRDVRISGCQDFRMSGCRTCCRVTSSILTSTHHVLTLLDSYFVYTVATTDIPGRRIRFGSWPASSTIFTGTRWTTLT